MMREWMARHTKANERMKNQVVGLKRQINQGLRNRQAIIENLEKQFKYLDKKILRSDSLPHTTNTKPRHEFVYKPPSIRNENDKGDVKLIEEDEIKHIPTIPNPNLINSNSPIVPPFRDDCTVHISYTNAKTFANVVLLNHVGREDLNSIYGVGTGRMTKKEIKKDNNDVSKEPNKEWKQNEKVHVIEEDAWRFLALGWHLEEIHVTWAQLEKKQTRLRTYTKSLEELCI
ncbi:hypothetical protein Tco_1245250 [Tanacetum coccineum]